MGHVIRSRDPEDERVVRVGLSPRARVLADQILHERRAEVEAALAGMDDGVLPSFPRGSGETSGKAEVTRWLKKP